MNFDYTFGKWGYPGITIPQNVVDWSGVLTLTVDCSFLNPDSGWNPRNGMIDAINIYVPSTVKLKSIVAEGAYYTNMSITGLTHPILASRLPPLLAEVCFYFALRS